jgi:hypothetical protein
MRSNLLGVDPDPKVVGEHRLRFLDFDSIPGFSGTFSCIGFRPVPIWGDHTGVNKANIWLLPVFLLIIGNGSFDFDVQISLFVIVEPQHTDIHDQPPAHLNLKPIHLSERHIIRIYVLIICQE